MKFLLAVEKMYLLQITELHIEKKRYSLSQVIVQFGICLQQHIFRPKGLRFFIETFTLGKDVKFPGFSSN